MGYCRSNITSDLYFDDKHIIISNSSSSSSSSSGSSSSSTSSSSSSIVKIKVCKMDGIYCTGKSKDRYTRGVQISKKSRSHLKILMTRTVT